LIGTKHCANINAYISAGDGQATVKLNLYRAPACVYYQEVVAASTTAFTVTYNNGAVGVGATLTKLAPFSVLSLDGINPTVGQRVLIKDQTNTFENGIYVVTSVGSGAAAWVLTRTTDFDTPTEIVLGKYLYVTQGIVNGLKTWVNTSSVVNVGVDPIVFNQSGSVPLLPSSIGSINAAGTFTLNTNAGQGLNWTEIPRSGLDTATAQLNKINTSANINDAANDYGFNGWKLTNASQISDTDRFAIVASFSYAVPGTKIVVNSISLVPGDIATRPAPMQLEDVQKQCQRYYETSFPLITEVSQTVPRVTYDNILFALQTTIYDQDGGISFSNTSGFSNLYQAEKRAAPLLSIYSGTTTSLNPPNNLGKVQAFVMLPSLAITKIELNIEGRYAPIANTATYFNPYVNSGKKGFSYIGLNSNYSTVATGAAVSNTWINYHYIADARLGIV
jgi:hypothetical protein